MRKPSAYYRKGVLWGKDGYWIAVGYTDERFYFGNLTEAKRAACAMFCTVPSYLDWKKGA